jgi:type 2 lantibiotic biosynthesis protein LanM
VTAEVRSALSEEDVRELVAKASSLHERIAGGLVPAGEGPRQATMPVGADEATTRDRWKLWCDTLVKGDEAVFRRRLEWDGLDEHAVRPLLGDVRLAPGMVLPGWSVVLRAASERATIDEPADGPAASFLDASAPYPFEEVLAPFVTVARERLRAGSGAAYGRLAASAHRTLERDLLKSLTHYAVQALHLELTVARTTSIAALDRIALEASEAPGRAAYDAFVRTLRWTGMRAFLLEYAVLARQLAVITESWIDANAELLLRLHADWPAIAAAFGEGAAAPAEVVRVDAGLSDPHAGRRTVVALTFDTGLKIVYKPKSVGIEAAFQDLLAWLNARGEGLALRTTRVLACRGYGWAEFIERLPCADGPAAERYFQRAGMLLCLVYALEGVDCHRDNLIAHGEHPVLVDCEGLMQPRQRVDDMADDVLARFLAQEQLSHSVLRSGMLPHFQVRGTGAKRKVYDISALGGFHDEEEEATRLVWTHPNTDRMQVAWRTVTFRVAASGPSLAGRALGLADYCDHVVAGFRAMYATLVRHREALLAAGGPAERLAREPVRFIFRNTQTYGLLTQRLLDPDYQRDGVLRAIELDQLSRPHIPPATMLDQQKAAPSWWPVFGAELAAMQREDVPYFGTSPTSNVLLVPPGMRLEGLFQGPSVELIAARLRGLGEEDLERQVSYVQASLYGLGDAASPGRAAAVPAPPEIARLPSDEEVVGEAMRIAEEIARSAVRAGDSATWIAPQFVFRSERYLLYSLQSDLYTGLGGVAVFLAAAARVSGSGELAKLAHDTVRGLRRKLATDGPRLADLIGIGGATGMGSVVYGLTHMGRTLGDASLLADAGRAAALITPERIAGDTTLDVCDGVAGALMALVTLYEATHDTVALDRARLCGKHLARSAVRAGEGTAGWVTILDKVMVGFSHGVAGIVYALLRLHAVTGDEAMRDLARAAIAYEDGLFDPRAGNWPDLRRSGGDAFETASWCHGGAGITLGRLGGLASLDDPAVRRDIERGVALMLRRPVYNVDYACCGNAGLVDILLTASQRIGRADAREAALERAWRVVARARARGAYALDPVLPKQMLNPSFFQGVAGVGYTLLRLARTELPSVLLWA